MQLVDTPRPDALPGDIIRNTAALARDDLDREVYCILGMPIDAVDMSTVLRAIDTAAANAAAPFVLSTPNVNFLVNSQTDEDFRESLLLSDLCPPDGMPIVWIARLMGIPIRRRVAGSDIFDALKNRRRRERPLRLSLFGTTEGVAGAASERLNRERGGLNCVDWVCPGFGTVEELSHDRLIDRINESNADFLVAALGAKKGQLWLRRNHHRLQVPVRAHLGATINFAAGAVKRAPRVVQKLGLEWLWRIKEEPGLFRRYLHDGQVLVRLLATRAIPLAISARWLQLRAASNADDFAIARFADDHTATVRLSGYATARHAPQAISCLRGALASRKRIIVDLSQTRAVDARFLGLFLMVRKQLRSSGSTLRFIGVSPRLERQFRLNGLGYLLSRGKHHDVSTVG